MAFDWLIVGAGFTGATLAERLANAGQKVLVIDRRSHIAGNAFDEMDQTGIRVHRYGPHIFHTNSEKVWSYLSQFTSWRPYAHHVLGAIDGKLVPIPFNLNTLDSLFTGERAEQLSLELIQRYGLGVKVPILKLRETDDPGLRELGDYIYEKVFLHYTLKQWDLRPEQLDPAVTSRVPVLVGRDDRYFQDKYQAMPEGGYTAMFGKMLDHPNIELRTGQDFEVVRSSFPGKVVYTGSIDEYFNYQFGELPYRSLRFDFTSENKEFFQAIGTVNYPNEFDYTRITEMKYLTGQVSPVTSLVYEYPEAYKRGANIPYYPIPCAESKRAIEPYFAKAKELVGKVWFAGRLGDYQYYNMDQACARALSLFEKDLLPLLNE